MIKNCRFQLKKLKFLPKYLPKSEVEESRSKDSVNPIYWWIVQPQEETGLREGRFSLARSSRRTFPYDKERRSSSLYTDSSGGELSRTSSISMSTIMTRCGHIIWHTITSINTSVRCVKLSDH